MAADLLQSLFVRHKAGEECGIYSVCSSHPLVLQAAMQQALEDESPLLIESTSNQVDQFGGYTGMTPTQFVAFVHGIASTMHFPQERLILGGDHLGPNVWQQEPAEHAYAKAHGQIDAYVKAGYGKIHLDATMACGGDPSTALPAEVIAERTAALCETAERATAKSGQLPLYVIGSDVPVPGGAQHDLEIIEPTPVPAVQECITLTREAFGKRGLERAWDRVIAVVVQPGVEFNHNSVVEYDRERARQLNRYIASEKKLVYEAHSTDYQTQSALRKMVQDHFAILKVGPWLTYALREAVFALAEMESIWLGARQSVRLSRLIETMDAEMTRDPRYWQKHYHGDEEQVRFARHFSYSDRIRYYWPYAAVVEAMQRLFANLEQHPLPLTLISQYMPEQYQALRANRIANDPGALVRDKICSVTAVYAHAAGLAEPL